MENAKEVSLIRSVLTSEVKFVIGIIAFVAGVVAPYYGMRQDIALIQSDIKNINSNHEVHIQDLTQQIKDLNGIVKGQQDQIIEVQKEMIAIIQKR